MQLGFVGDMCCLLHTTCSERCQTTSATISVMGCVVARTCKNKSRELASSPETNEKAQTRLQTSNSDEYSDQVVPSNQRMAKGRVRGRADVEPLRDMLQNVLPAHGLFHLRTLAANHATHFAAASTDRVPWPTGRAPDLETLIPRLRVEARISRPIWRPIGGAGVTCWHSA